MNFWNVYIAFVRAAAGPDSVNGTTNVVLPAPGVELLRNACCRLKRGAAIVAMLKYSFIPMGWKPRIPVIVRIAIPSKCKRFRLRPFA